MVLLQGARGGNSQRGRRGGRDRQVVQVRQGGTYKSPGKSAAGGRYSGGRGGGGRRGSGRGRGGRGSEKPKSKEDLDKEMDSYFLGDSKHAQNKLNDDLEDYMKQKSKKPAATEGTTAAGTENAVGT